MTCAVQTDGLRNWKLIRAALPKNLRGLLGPCPPDVPTAARELEKVFRTFWKWQLEESRTPASKLKGEWKAWPEGKRTKLAYDPDDLIQSPEVGFDRREPGVDRAYAITGASQHSRAATLGWMLPDRPAPKVGSLTRVPRMRTSPDKRERDRALVAGAVSRGTLDDFPGASRWALAVAWLASRVNAFNPTERAWSLKSAASFVPAGHYSAPVALVEWVSRHVTGGRSGGHGRLTVATAARLLLDRDALLEKLTDGDFADWPLRRALLFGRQQPVWSEADVLRGRVLSGERVAAASK